MRHVPSYRSLGALFTTLGVGSCLGTPAAPQLSGNGMPILFIGNSHTYVNDVPGILQALADSAGGEEIGVESVALPNYAVIDHWYGGTARVEIGRRTWSYVVLQQGWTPAGVCRDTLRLATQLFATEIRKAGAQPALYETWPPVTRPDQFQGSIESYRLAAKDVNGVLFPVAEAWLAVSRRDPSINLYLDGLHANTAGSYLAAVVMYTRIFRPPSTGLPARLRTRAGTTIDVSPGLAATLQAAADEVGLAATPDVAPTAPPVITSTC